MLDDLKRKLDNYEEPEIEGLWEDILSRTGSASRKSGWKVILIPAAAAACIAISLLVTLRREPLHQEVIAEVSSEQGGTDAPVTVIPAPEGEIAYLDPDNILRETPPVSTAPAAQPVTDPVQSNAETAEPETEKTAEVPTTTPEVSSSPTDPSLSESISVPERITDYPAFPEDIPERIRKSRLDISLSTSNLPGTTYNSTGYSQASNMSSPILPSTTMVNGLWEDPIGNIAMKNSGREINTKTSYKPPVRAGLSVRYTFPCRVGIESGMSYTYLSSNTVSGTKENNFTTEETLHYIGIPLIVSYDIWDSRFIDLYIAAGGTYEKAIEGTRTYTYRIDNENRDGIRSESIDSRPDQWSVNAVAGFQFNILDNLGLYVEPGIGYFFDDGSELNTIYKSKPFNFYLRFGLRFSISMSRTL